MKYKIAVLLLCIIFAFDISGCKTQKYVESSKQTLTKTDSTAKASTGSTNSELNFKRDLNGDGIEEIITDVDNTNHGMFKDGNEKNIRLKVKTKDGAEGWLEWLNGGD